MSLSEEERFDQLMAVEPQTGEVVTGRFVSGDSWDRKAGRAIKVTGQTVDAFTDKLGKWGTTMLVSSLVGMAAYNIGAASADESSVKVEPAAAIAATTGVAEGKVTAP